MNKLNEAPGYPETADIHASTDEYAARFSGATGAWMLGVQERIMLDQVRRSDARTVLDVGGGHGQLARPLCREGYEVTVLSSAPECVRRISDLVEAGRCRFVVGNVLEPPFPEKSFDVVVCFRLVMHCERWPGLIAALCRTARKAVVLDYPTTQGINSLAPALFGAKKKLEGNTRQWRPFRHAEIADAFAANGFRCDRRSGQFFLPMALHRALKIKPLSQVMEAVPRALGMTRRWGSPVIARMVP